MFPILFILPDKFLQKYSFEICQECIHRMLHFCCGVFDLKVMFFVLVENLDRPLDSYPLQIFVCQCVQIKIYSSLRSAVLPFLSEKKALHLLRRTRLDFLLL